MINIKHLVKKYNDTLVIEKLKIDEKDKYTDNEIPFTLWPDNFLPPTEFTLKGREKELDIMERLCKRNLLDLSNKKLVMILTSIDLLLMRSVTAQDLISYEGSTGSNSILHLQNMNKSLLIWFTREFETRRLFRMLKYTVEVKNYNLMNSLVKGIQGKRLSDKDFEELAHYKGILGSQDNGIFPFEWMLNDCEDSNLNIKSEIASLRFCKIVEKLKEIKEIMIDYVLKEKEKQIVFSKMWIMSQKVNDEYEKCNASSENIYLIV